MKKSVKIKLIVAAIVGGVYGFSRKCLLEDVFLWATLFGILALGTMATWQYFSKPTGGGQ